MKRVLFIGITEYDLHAENSNLRKKFEGLSRGLKPIIVARGRPFHKHMWNSDFYLLPRLFYMPSATLIACYVCLSKRIDVIVCQGPLTEGFIGVILKMFFRKELIVEIHGDWREGPFLNKKRLFTPILKKIAPMIGRLSLSCASKIRTLTRIGKYETQARFPGKQYFVFPTFTDIDIFLAEKDTSFQKYICTAAVLSPIKNIGTLIEAFARISQKFPEFKLVIAGDGPSLRELRVTSYELRVTDKVKFAGRLSQEELKNTLKDCYMFVLPSLSEGFGRVFIEAMALSKPVIGGRVGGVPEIIQDGRNGFLVEPRDKEALAKKMEILLRYPDLTKKMGESGRVFVRENFSNEKYIKNYIDMINA